ncbi:Y75 [Tupaiid betaherpesvirus 1]|uniref:Y75 n=1 Tax=Tupaiid herpesvirus 1 (strain 1) TaxID=10397 RepID=Q91TM1_TUHV1|nr:Y75 [Tupaiid betaherpesvirus 1]AAK57120.1 Y75 [Tupaiid betaherpesvirus 1]
MPRLSVSPRLLGRVAALLATVALAAAVGAGVRAPTGPIFFRYPNRSDPRTEYCLHNITRNQSLVQDGLITLNFWQEDGRTVKIFQVPRCIFTTPEAEELMRHVDLTETLEDYRFRFQRYFISSLFGAYRLLGHSVVSPTPPPPTAATRPVSEPNRDGDAYLLVTDGRRYFVNVSEPHRLNFERNDPCQFFLDHPVLFPLLLPCQTQTLHTPQRKVTLSFTPDFFVLEIHQDPVPILLIFGRTDWIDAKAPYDGSLFYLRQTTHHDLWLVADTNTVLVHYPFLARQSFLNRTLSLNYYDRARLERVFEELALQVLLYPSPTTAPLPHHTVELLFSYALMVFVADRDDPGLLPFEDFLERHLALVAAERFLASSFDASPPLLRYDDLVPTLRLFGRHPGPRAPSPDVWLKVAALLAESGQLRLLTLEQAAAAVSLVDSIHHEATLTRLSPRHREDLYLLNEISHRSTDFLPLRRHILTAQTSLCSPREIFLWNGMVYKGAGLSLRSIYTPCFGGGRRDYTTERLDELFGLTTSGKLHRHTLHQLLKRFRPTRLGTFPQLACLPDDVPHAVIPLGNYTYVLSPRYLLYGRTFPITNTVIGNDLVLTVTDEKRNCTRTELIHDPGTITVVKNITSTQRCEFCDSALVEYDEVKGLTDIFYLPTLSDILYVTDPANGLLAASPRTHYLLFTRNATVLEVTDFLVEIKETPVILIIVFALLSIGALFCLYRFCRLV